ncbi:hypothetical protein QO207_30950 [Pseudomonas sp. CAN2814]|uniref:hypothetical protein n=1 Tax=Pseudomonas sp. CAN1 TaxID=3046726 RepID=UPI00264955E6|nr:hypothetical protein [Pseudomonas sp. CAN1]MDN6861032.1 hypothetical protein [Pseudomonas sp. CAN1]
MAKANPFIPPGKDYGAVDTESRLRALEDFDLEQCHAALEVLGLQATVEKKLRTRIRALEKQAAQCETMQRPKSGCGCPDCGSSLIDVPGDRVARMPHPKYLQVWQLIDAALFDYHEPHQRGDVCNILAPILAPLVKDDIDLAKLQGVGKGA